ncbi:hypothetical protein [Xanthomonas arboricola]|uniref:hypothetical protein n=1 Tax=Xanthomonas arboricola TaxID=56448 RepID=UPI00161EC3B1|nr:hypothetical protein [Xanthomonas arboricola]
MEALDQARAPLTQVILASAAATNYTAGKNASSPLTKLLHNGRVQTGTGVSCMGNKRGSAEFTAARPLLWPLEYAVGVGIFSLSVCISMPFSQQNCPLVQSFNEAVGNRAYLHRVDGARQYCVALLASFFGGYQRSKRMRSRATLQSLASDGWHRSEPLAYQVFRRQSEPLEETTLNGLNAGMDLMLRRTTAMHCY